MTGLHCVGSLCLLFVKAALKMRWSDFGKKMQLYLNEPEMGVFEQPPVLYALCWIVLSCCSIWNEIIVGIIASRLRELQRNISPFHNTRAQGQQEID